MCSPATSELALLRKMRAASPWRTGHCTSKMGSTYEVNSAAITCGNLHTANATVYIINTVLMPIH
jgi:hypothetical protein